VKKKTKKKDINYYMRLKYKMEIVPFSEEDGGGYEARIPQLGKKAFRGYGDTPEEALAHLEVVKRDLFESYIKDGVLIPEPEPEEERYSGRILLRVPIYLHKELSELAKKEDISLNQLLNHLIERGLASLRYEDNSFSLTKQTNQSLIAKIYEPVSAYKSKKMGIKKRNN
jgi:predicted RNase H-like HicB family nuclease